MKREGELAKTGPSSDRVFALAIEIAKADPSFETGSGDLECPYCSMMEKYEEHDSGCSWIRLRDLLRLYGLIE